MILIQCSPVPKSTGKAVWGMSWIDSIPVETIWVISWIDAKPWHGELIRLELSWDVPKSAPLVVVLRQLRTALTLWLSHFKPKCSIISIFHQQPCKVISYSFSKSHAVRQQAMQHIYRVHVVQIMHVHITYWYGWIPIDTNSLWTCLATALLVGKTELGCVSKANGGVGGKERSTRCTVSQERWHLVTPE